MTKEEAIYWKGYIDRQLTEKLERLTGVQVDSAKISGFADSYMQTVVGQEYLSQGLFREFLKIFAGIPQLQEEIKQAQDEINDTISGCDDKDMEQLLDGLMWDEDYMWLPSMDIDEEGFVALNIEIDEEGWAHFVDE